MALDSYSGLQTEIADWLNRSDLTTKIPTFIVLAESTMRRRLRRFSAREDMTIAALAVSSPCAAAELRSIYLRTGSPHLDKPLNIVTPEILADMRATQAGVSGRPRWAAVTSSGKELLFAPTPDTSYTAEVIYFKALQALSTANTVNDELAAAPDMYLYGALLQAEPYLEHDERIPVWKEKFDSAIQELNTMRENEEHGASLQPVRLPTKFV